MASRQKMYKDVAIYQQLVDQNAADSDLLTGMSREELEALATSSLALAVRSRLDVLLAQQKERAVSEVETAELDELLAQSEQLTLLQTRARYTLAQTDTIQ